MNYCKKCLNVDTRPNSKFSDDGVCTACEYHDKYLLVDWSERREILLELADQYRNSSAQYDCIIGVSGGKDSFRQAIWVRDFLNLRPLLVCLAFPPHQVTEIGVANLSALIEEGFDVIQSCPAPETWRQLMRAGFLKFGNWRRSTEMALFSAVPQLAIDYKIPLILDGENPGLQLGDLGTLGSTGYDGNNLRNMNTLDGGNIQWMKDEGFDNQQLLPYCYPTPAEFDEHNVQIVYLGWFLGDWSMLNNGAISALTGIRYRVDEAKNTSDLYGVSSLDEDWVTVNNMLRYLKYGWGTTTDYVNEMIRLGTISRAEAIVLVEKYDGACSDHYIEAFSNYIEISVDLFWEKALEVANRDLFEVIGARKIQPKFEVGVGITTYGK